MAIRSTMNVSLTPALERFILDRVESGRFQSSSEVVREALRIMERVEQEREAAMAGVRAKIDAGFEQLDRGVTVDGEAAFEALRERGRKFRAAGG